MNNIYFSLDEARAELARRWQDQELRSAVEAELAGQMLAEFRAQPRAVIFRQLLSPDNGCMFFMQAARYVGGVPFATEFLGDIFTPNNPEKQGWGRLRATVGKRRALIDLVSFTANNKKKISEVVTHAGEGLADFHHRLLEIAGGGGGGNRTAGSYGLASRLRQACGVLLPLSAALCGPWGVV